MIVPVLLAGGSGNRLWPLSRELYPKQCLSLANDARTLVQNTLLRVRDCELTQPPIVVCNNEHRFLIAQQIADIGLESRILLEPAARNTAAAIALAAFEASAANPEATLLVLPADHLIDDQQAFCDALESARDSAEAGKLVTFGVVPEYPEPGYGYIEAQAFGKVSRITAFHEKPDTDTARRYLEAGNYYWNSGMFLFSAKSFLSELDRFAPSIHEAVRQSVAEKYTDLDFVRAGEEAFQRAPSVSVDVAVMEKTGLGVVVPFKGGWSDVGSWNSVYDTQAKDGDNNVLTGDVLVEDSHDSYIYSSSRLVAALGISGLAIIDTEDALLVMERGRGQDVKKIVTRLKQAKRTEHRSHTRIFRPWGSVETMNIADHYQVKHVLVNPGGRISMQVHHHRAEHWIVVKGTAEVVNADEKRVLAENQSLYIAVGDIHSLSNPGPGTLEIIEVQTGNYFGEDDVVRFTDKYRSESEG